MKLSPKTTLRKATGLVAFLLCTTLPCHAAGLIVLSAGAVKPALEELAPEFQKTTGTKLEVDYAPVGVLMRRLAQGNIPDALILSADVVKEVEARAWVPSGSAMPLGSVGVGVAVKQGSAIPDISTPEALRQALLAAKSVTYMDPQKGTSGKHFADVLAQLGIAEQVRPKTTLGDVGYVLEPVARGEIELGDPADHGNPARQRRRAGRSIAGIASESHHVFDHADGQAGSFRSLRSASQVPAKVRGNRPFQAQGLHG